MHYKYTPWAILLTFVLLFPGMVIGWLASRLYWFFTERYITGGIINWATSGWFDKLLFAVIPNVIHGVVGGGIGLYAVSKILKSANYEIVAYSVSAVVVVLTAITLLMMFSGYSAAMDILATACNTTGIVLGFFIAQKHASDMQLQAHAAPQNAGAM